MFASGNTIPQLDWGSLWQEVQTCPPDRLETKAVKRLCTVFFVSFTLIAEKKWQPPRAHDRPN